MLAVRREGDLLELDFPISEGKPCAPPAALVEGLGTAPLETQRARDYMAVFASADEVRTLRPDLGPLASLDARGVIVTAPGGAAAGNGPDYVLRFFGPAVGVPEDPATGSAHCTLMPYWAKRLGRARLASHQLSARGGEFVCERRGARVGIAGRAVPYLEGSIELPG
ncbi:MAG TPA: PhzF family phenazine biosynthesis protein [Candidatus Eisenbacteria bacterium]